MRPRRAYDSWLTERVDMAIKAIIRNINYGDWGGLMLKSRIILLMNL